MVLQHIQPTQNLIRACVSGYASHSCMFIHYSKDGSKVKGAILRFVSPRLFFEAKFQLGQSNYSHRFAFQTGQGRDSSHQLANPRATE